MKIEHVNIDLVKLNPRTIKDDKFKKLVKSIQDFPQMLKIRPIVVNDDMIVLGGNMRLKACQDAGLKKVYIIKADELTPEQQREFIIKDNVGFGEWDVEMLKTDFDLEELTEWGMDLPKLLDSIDDLDDEGNFDDEGIQSKNQYGVIVMCESEGTQEATFKRLTDLGYICKVVVT